LLVEPLLADRMPLAALAATALLGALVYGAGAAAILRFDPEYRAIYDHLHQVLTQGIGGLRRLKLRKAP
jgi:hypothetical protein